MIEVLLEFLGELLLQLVLEMLLEFGFHAVSEPFRKPPNPWLAALGYVLLGAACGGLSLAVFPAYLTSPSWRIPNLILTPIAAGLLMTALGAWRARRGDPVLRIDRFLFGYLFALSLALVRFSFAS
jgi:hypothetical protein